MNASNEIGSAPCSHCLICGSAGVILYQGMHDRLFAAPGQWNMRRCADSTCGLVWMDPMPRIEEIAKAYQSYYTHAPATPLKNCLHQFSDRLVAGYLARHYGYVSPSPHRLDEWLSGLLWLMPGRRVDADFSVFWLPAQPGGKLLEVGCGSGQMLARMRDQGWEVRGVDFDPEAVNTASARGLDVRLGSLASQGFAANQFDVVVMSHVIEHVHDPLELLTQAHQVLKPGGTLVVLTPNNQSLWHRWFQSNWMSLDPPRHLHLFNRATMERLVGQAGFSQPALRTIIRDANGSYMGSQHIRATGRHDMSRIYPIAERVQARLMQGLEWLMGEVVMPDCGEELLVLAHKS